MNRLNADDSHSMSNLLFHWKGRFHRHCCLPSMRFNTHLWVWKLIFFWSCQSKTLSSFHGNKLVILKTVNVENLILYSSCLMTFYFIIRKAENVLPTAEIAGGKSAFWDSQACFSSLNQNVYTEPCKCDSFSFIHPQYYDCSSVLMHGSWKFP